MKKFLLILSLLAVVLPGMSAQDKLYLMVRNPYFGADWTPSENDPFLVENEDGIYEGEVDFVKSDAFVFYQMEGEDVVLYTPISLKQIQFNNVDVYETDFEKNGSSLWLFSKFNPATLQEATVSMKVDLKNLTATFEQTDVPEEIIDHVYVWGSSDWGLSFRDVYEMTPSADNAGLFSATINIPEIGNYDGDPEYGPSADDPKNGYYLLLSVSDANLFSNTRFTAPLDSKVVDVKEDDVFDITLIKNMGAPMIFLSYGEMTLTFNAETYEFTAQYAENSDNPDDPGAGVSSLNADSKVNIYDLNGNKVDQNRLRKGIYIINGRKVMK